MNKLIYSAPLLLLLGACTSSTNISHVYPFSLYVGKTVAIQRPMAVVSANNRWLSGSGGVSTLSWTVSRGLVDTNSVRSAMYAVLPAGHQVFIDSIRDEVAFDSESIIAYGRTTIPPEKKPIRFAYAWGFLWILEQAPWEPDTLPKYRHIPDRFRLPAHFDYDMFRAPTNAPTWDAKPAEQKD